LVSKSLAATLIILLLSTFKVLGFLEIFKNEKKQQEALLGMFPS
jgi:hypothetical protein